MKAFLGLVSLLTGQITRIFTGKNFNSFGYRINNELESVLIIYSYPILMTVGPRSSDCNCAPITTESDPAYMAINNDAYGMKDDIISAAASAESANTISIANGINVNKKVISAFDYGIDWAINSSASPMDFSLKSADNYKSIPTSDYSTQLEPKPSVLGAVIVVAVALIL